MLVKSSKRSRSNLRKHKTRKSHKKVYMKRRRTHMNKSRKHHNKNKSRRNTKYQRGGFRDCSLATVQEQGFNIPSIGDIPGLSLSDSKAVIYRPNCKTDTYQAMVPSS
jgi:hypothetical protein